MQATALLNGTNQYFQAADSTSLSFTGNHTIEGFLKVVTPPGAGVAKYIITKDTESVTGRTWATYYANGIWGAGLQMAHFIFAGGGASNYTRVVWSIDLGTTAFKHFAIVTTIANAAATKCELFIDGVSQGNGTAVDIGTGCTALTDTTTKVVIGSFDGGAGTIALNAYFSNFRIWNTTRSASQIATKRCSVLGTATGLVAEWTLDNIVTDNSGNANTLTTFGSDLFSTTMPTLCNLFSWQDATSLPAAASPLATPYGTKDSNSLLAIDSTVAVASGQAYIIQEFRDIAPNNTLRPKGTWTGSSSLAPAISPVILQVYNVTSATWETVATDSATAENTSFTLTGTASGTASDYYDGSLVATFRVYQLT